MKVRAKQDGVYGGYYRHGPIESEAGTIAAEVFEIDDGEYPAYEPGTKNPIMENVIGPDGQPVMERISKQAVDGRGSPVVDEKGRPVMIAVEQPKMKARTWTHFAPEWMEAVDENEEVTYDLPKFEIPAVYRTKKTRVPSAAAVGAAPVPKPAASNLIPVI